MNSDIVKYKGRLYFSENQSMANPRSLEGAYVEFFVNGESQGKVFTDVVLEGTYYPAISMYTHTRQVDAARIRANFGSEEGFLHPPPPGSEARPACQLPFAPPLPED